MPSNEASVELIKAIDQALGPDKHRYSEAEQRAIVKHFPVQHLRDPRATEEVIEIFSEVFHRVHPYPVRPPESAPISDLLLHLWRLLRWNARWKDYEDDPSSLQVVAGERSAGSEETV